MGFLFDTLVQLPREQYDYTFDQAEGIFLNFRNQGFLTNKDRKYIKNHLLLEDGNLVIDDYMSKKYGKYTLDHYFKKQGFDWFSVSDDE